MGDDMDRLFEVAKGIAPLLDGRFRYNRLVEEMTKFDWGNRAILNDDAQHGRMEQPKRHRCNLATVPKIQMTTYPQNNIEIYKMYVETIGKNESKRLQANATYITLTGALITVSASVPGIDLIVPAIVGLALSVIWFLTIKHHLNISKAKFEVLQHFESKMDYQPFAEEWKLVRESRWPISLTMVESLLPVSFGLTCVFYIGYRIA